ncbi:trigger factor [Fulvivirga maritima]|uniref:trigger factor n=1 Tax=Fulvivirga maritima TaxID=2904247 RepID=UPI001F2232DC|nr:trigger factor [Fulvivirga maritima]UII27063.1 trigger factor [Fulvivirga maritima]
MDITLDKKSPTEAAIKVTLKESDYQPNVEEKVKDFAKKASIKGFRPGKVPPGLIKKMYGKSIVVEEINNILSKSLSDYIKNENIQLIGEPLPDEEKAAQIDWDNQKDFEFDYNIGMVDDFKYNLSEKEKLTSYTIELDKKTLDETLDNVKKQFGNSVNPETSEEGDSLYGLFEQVDGDISNEALLDLNWENITKKDQKKFTGLKKDDTVEFDIEKVVKDPHAVMHLLNIGHDEAHELKGKFTLTVKNINRTEPAELNQELFDKVFGKDAVSSEEEFINKVKETVEDNYKRETDFFLDQTIKDHFVSKTKMEIPEEFLKNWLLRTNENITQADLDKEFDEYVKSLKWDLIKNKIAEDNEIKVENEEVVDRAKSMILQQLGGAGAAEQLKDHMDAFADNYLKAENGQNYMKVFTEVRDEKIVNFIKEKVTITEKKVDVEGFKKIVEK